MKGSSTSNYTVLEFNSTEAIKPGRCSLEYPIHGLVDRVI